MIERLDAALEGRYRVEREIGAGGMATVYLAHDERHDRKVALKVLRADLAAVMGGDRFLSEIRTTANLQHPHILPLFDSGEADGFLFYVMPFVEGESLRARLNREKQLAVDEAVRIARAMANALDYAHRQGVIHRDVKPENVLLHDGEPLVADFGIALAVTAAGGGRLTETGLSLGTPYYMSPEQATADRDPGPRSDVYSLGCVLYEMLVGDPPHTGSSAQAVLAKILTEEPRPVTQLRRTVPTHVAGVVARSLERLPADRFESAGEFSGALDDPAFRHETVAKGTGLEGREVPGAPGGGSPGPGWALALAMPALAVGLVAGLLLKPAPESPVAQAARFNLTGDSIHSLIALCCGPSLAIAPDGSMMVYEAMAEGRLALWSRPMGEIESRELPGTEGATNISFSSDGEWVGFVQDGALKKVRISGGAPSTILAAGTRVSGVTWTEANTIIYGDDDTGLIRRVSVDGGEPETLTALDSARSEGLHQHPHALPGGRTVVFHVTTIGISDRWVEFLDLESGDRRTVVRGSSPQYVGDDRRGHLLFVTSDGSVMAVGMDPTSGDTLGGAFRVEDGVILRPDGMGEFAASRNGTVLARRGAGVNLALTRVDRDGMARPLGPRGDVRAPRFSPDGQRIAYEVQGDASSTGDQIWILAADLQQPEQRLTFEGDNSWPTWSADGRSVLFDRDTPTDSLLGVYRRAADFSGTAERVLAQDVWEPYMSWSGGRLLWSQEDDIWVRDPDGGEPRTLVATSFRETSPAVSPDGRWLAYTSNESGASEVYVQPFPGGGARYRVSTAGGVEPLWNPAGGELLYRSGGGVLSVAVPPGDAWQPSQEVVLFEDRFDLAGNARNWDVSPDGQSFLFVDGGQSSQRITVTVNAVQPGR